MSALGMMIKQLDIVLEKIRVVDGILYDGKSPHKEGFREVRDASLLLQDIIDCLTAWEYKE